MIPARPEKKDQDGAVGSPSKSGKRPGTARTPGPREGGTRKDWCLPTSKARTQRPRRSRSLGQRLPPKPQAPHTSPPAAPRGRGPRPYLNASAEEGGGFIPLQPGLPGLWTQPPPRTAPPPSSPGPRAGLYFLLDPERHRGRGPKCMTTPLAEQGESTGANSLAPPLPAASGPGRGCVRRGSG